MGNKTLVIRYVEFKPPYSNEQALDAEFLTLKEHFQKPMNNVIESIINPSEDQKASAEALCDMNGFILSNI